MAKTKSTTKAKTGKQKLAAAAPSAPNIDIGITQGDRKKIADGLSRFQADAFTLYLKTHNFHWNVTGSMFNSLHTMFETQYTEQWAALDDVAERIRALGFNAPGSYREFAALTSIAEEPGLTDSADWREWYASWWSPTKRSAVRHVKCWRWRPRVTTPRPRI